MLVDTKVVCSRRGTNEKPDQKVVVFKRLSFQSPSVPLLLVFRNDDDARFEEQKRRRWVVVVGRRRLRRSSTRKFELKKRAFARDLLSAPRDSTIDFGRRKKRIMLTRIQKNEAPPHLWAKDDGVVPRRPSWRPVRRTRLAGRTRARRRPVCTLFDE